MFCFNLIFFLPFFRNLFLIYIGCCWHSFRSLRLGFMSSCCSGGLCTIISENYSFAKGCLGQWLLQSLFPSLLVCYTFIYIFIIFELWKTCCSISVFLLEVTSSTSCRFIVVVYVGHSVCSFGRLPQLACYYTNPIKYHGAVIIFLFQSR